MDAISDTRRVKELEFYSPDIKHFAKSVNNFNWYCDVNPHNTIFAMCSSALLGFCVDGMMNLPKCKVNVVMNKGKTNRYDLTQINRKVVLDPNGIGMPSDKKLL